jgi:hypothetical protein
MKTATLATSASVMARRAVLGMLLDEIHVMGTRLLEVASTAASRVSPAETPEESPRKDPATSQTGSTEA